MLFKIKGKPVNINIIQLYAPTTTSCSEEEIQSFYDAFEVTISQIGSHKLKIIMRNFNLKARRGWMMWLVTTTKTTVVF